ncbi:hypothetical protein ColLi_09825 [Colletotrichum liriopes]|uniref:Uncharacterized protein n=1 Tax=Colletotrichum liriopes TaxID=708192 RepID=A0AA37GV00_9PEZI|nr:hypothetical protein ColLi_09825 [Colletotrichum liriopes]
MALDVPRQKSTCHIHQVFGEQEVERVAERTRPMRPPRAAAPDISSVFTSAEKGDPHPEEQRRRNPMGQSRP